MLFPITNSISPSMNRQVIDRLVIQGRQPNVVPCVIQGAIGHTGPVSVVQMGVAGTGNIQEWRNSAGAALVVIGPESGHIQTITAGTLTDQKRGLKITGTMPAAAASYNTLVEINATSTNNGSNQYPFYMTMLSGATQAKFYSAGAFENYAAGIGTDPQNFQNGNVGMYGYSPSNTVGHNVGIFGWAEGGLVNYGVLGRAATNAASKNNVAVMGYGLNGGASGIQVGGFFGLMTATPTFTSSALMADNGSTTSPIFVARDNGTAVFTIADGSVITFADGVNVNLNATTGTKWGRVTDKQAWFGATPVVQPAHANQAAVTDSTTGTASFTLNDVGAVFSQTTSNGNFATLARQINEIRNVLVNTGLMKGSV